MGNKTTIALIIVAFAALLAFNPGEEQLKNVFMDHAHNHFFELPRDYQKIYEHLRTQDTARQRTYDRLLYKNFLLFSTLSYDEGGPQTRKILSIGALGIAVPVIL